MTPIQNPLLADGELPAFSAIAPDQVLPAIDAVLADYQAIVDRLTADPQARTFDQLIAPLEQMEERLGRSFAPVSHLHGVKDSPALRTAYSAALEKITEPAHRGELAQRGRYQRRRMGCGRVAEPVHGKFRLAARSIGRFRAALPDRRAAA